MDKVDPLCSVFGECGGCEYQNVVYEDELRIKEAGLKELFHLELGLSPELIEPVLSSPKEYYYRHRLDLSLKKTRDGIVIGFTDQAGKWLVDIEACPIALEKVSDFIPQLKKEAIEKLPLKYRTATLTVKSSDEGRVHWGGIGRRSLRQDEEDYLWTQINGKKIYFSLETFFQANLSILPFVVEKIRLLPIWNKESSFYDLYSGVGLFGLSLEDLVQKVVMIEDSPHSHKLAEYNLAIHQLAHVQAYCGQSEQLFEELLSKEEKGDSVVMVDPPRKGLSDLARNVLLSSKEKIKDLLYLSCHPETLIRDLKEMTEKGWEIKKVMPLDFFPKTKHLETLVWLK